MSRLTVLVIASVLSLGLIRSIQAAQRPIDQHATDQATIQMLRTALSQVMAERNTAIAERAFYVERARSCVSSAEMARVLKLVAANPLETR